MKSTNQLVKEIKESGEDFEWYPTTNEILNTIKSDMAKTSRYLYQERPSVLDCGAGDGRALVNLTQGDRYAIEKSRPLIEAMDKSILIIGTEFNQQVLIDKQVDVIFCNPPYSEFKQWTNKIIKEANAKIIYLVIPERWKEDKEIINNIEQVREAKYSVIGNFDFLNADRAARAKVDIVRISLYSDRGHTESDPFNIWFEENFNIQINQPEKDYREETKKQKERIKTELVNGSDFTQTLERLYQRDLAHLISNYKAIESLDPELLLELGIALGGVKAGLKLKIKGLKDVYWKEFFSRMEKITNKLTHSNRTRMVEKLMENTSVDFTVSNAYALVIWAIKNANIYFDTQLVETFEKMISAANIINYKSNKNTFDEEKWRWNRDNSYLDKVKLDYRVVLTNTGGLRRHWLHAHYELAENAVNFLNDIRTVAHNLGYLVGDYPSAERLEWTGGEVSIECYDFRKGEEAVLMKARAFKNGNLHIKFNQDFLCRLNVEFGRLKGWVKTAKEAEEELELEEGQAVDYFKSNIKIAMEPNLLMIESLNN